MNLEGRIFVIKQTPQFDTRANNTVNNIHFPIQKSLEEGQEIQKDEK
jgi:hypothetical protein